MSDRSIGGVMPPRSTGKKRRGRRLSGPFGASLVAAAALVLGACGQANSSQGSSAAATPGSGGKGSLVLDIGQGDTGPVRNFNPFLPTSALDTDGAQSYIYEPLLQFDLLKPGTTYPWLATSYHWANGDRRLTFDLRTGVHWRDGKPFTAADVVYTLDVLKRYPQLNTNGITFTSIRAEGPHTVVMTFAKPANTELYYIASTLIVPKHLWATVKNPSKYPNPDPVGTGPMMVKSFNANLMVFVRNPHYWMKGKPKVTELRWRSINSNNTADMYLLKGDFDWAAYFEPNLKKDYVAKSKYYHYWFPPTSVVSLFPNLKVWPLEQLPVRQAISLAISRKTIGNVGEDGYETPQGVTGLLLPYDKAYLLPRYAHLSTARNVPEAKKVLQKAGWTMGPNGIFQKGGKALSFTIVDPSAYTDYMTDIQVIASELRQAGMHVTIKGESANSWTQAVNDGQYQATVLWGSSGPTPYYAYYTWLSESLGAPIGKPATGDQERFHSPAAQRYLAEYQNASTSGERMKAIHGLQTVMATNLPVIPLVGAAAWGEYQTNKFTGWPTASNPYETAQSGAVPANEVVLLHLKPVSKGG